MDDNVNPHQPERNHNMQLLTPSASAARPCRRPHPNRSLLIAAVCGTGLALSLLAADQAPPVIDPGPPPGDATILFDGTDLSQWQSVKGSPAPWEVTDGILTVKPGSGNIMTKAKFGAVQLHIEWASPAKVTGDGQGRGNSGVYLQGRYEIQVLDSYQNPTYHNGQAGAFYGHNAPLVNCCRRPGEWQTYDIIFHPPKTGADGKVIPGSFTVLQNGILVQDHIPVPGQATTAASFSGVTPEGPLVLQDHGHPVRFRNIWIRRLNEGQP
jgi:3-keto-disaccharide hydrolase